MCLYVVELANLTQQCIGGVGMSGEEGGRVQHEIDAEGTTLT